MRESIPLVSDGILLLPGEEHSDAVAVGSAAWFTWLAAPNTRSFAFHGEASSFTARKEERRRGTTYWSAYRSIQGRVRKAYLGTATALTLERLTATARTLVEEVAAASTPKPPAPAAPNAAPFLRTKLFMPPPRRQFVARDRLYRQISAGLRRRLLLLTGAAGSGKTTLLSSWYEAQGTTKPALAWLSLDESDNDPIRFWRTLCATLDTVSQGIGSTVVALTSQQQQSLAGDILITELVNVLLTLPHNLIIVLDDYHVISEPEIHRPIARLIERLPAQIQLVIASRAEPPLPSGRLRANGDLAELRADDLRFTHDEVDASVNGQLRLELSAEAITLLAERTEGWAVGLQLAALALSGRPVRERASYITTFSGSHRFVGDYLIEEVLNGQDDAARHFLLSTALLNRLCGPLCDAVIDGTISPPLSGSERLDTLERAGLFVIPLDDEGVWYRYHRLFADLLQKQLRQEAPAAIPTLYLRASAWCEKAGLLDEAIEYALAARDTARAADLIERTAQATTIRNEHQTIQRWLNALPPELVQGRPQLGLAKAWSHALRWPSAETTTYLPTLENDPRYAPYAGEIAAYWAVSLLLRDLPRCIAYGERALALLPTDNVFLRSSASVSLGVAYWLSGDFANAERIFQLTILLNAPIVSRLTDANTGDLPPEQVGAIVPLLIAQQTLGDVRRVQGRLREAEEHFVRAVDLARVSDNQLLPAFGAATAVGYLASLRYEQNDLGEALRLIDLGLSPTQRAINGDSHWSLLRYRAQFAWASGDDAGAHESLEQLDAVVERMNQPLPLILTSLTYLRYHLARGDAQRANAEAAQLLERLAGIGVGDGGAQPPPHYSAYLWEQQEIELARVDLLNGRAAQALLRAEHVGATAERLGHHSFLIPVNSLLALALAAEGQAESAATALLNALEQAEPIGYRRLFTDFGKPLHALLAPLLAAQSAKPATPKREALIRYGQQILATFAAQDEPAHLPETGGSEEPLTPREREILAMLADGLPNQEIANHLFIASSTVKWHVNRICGKLGAGNRLGAVARGRARGLLA
jgi:LuxR family maltose regulon positive regulatory protein